MSDEEVVNLIFLPGFSMAEKVTDVSGRGVGMDAVKSKVESLGGQFDVSTELGVGTRVFLRLPLTLAIVLALLIKVGDETYALPLENVEETILVNRASVKTVHGTPATCCAASPHPVRPCRRAQTPDSEERPGRVPGGGGSRQDRSGLSSASLSVSRI